MAETDKIIRTSDQIAPARPSLSLERRLAKALMQSEARKCRGERKTGKATPPVRRKRRRKRSEKFVRLTLELIKSEAYLDLPPSAARMLIQFLAKPGEAFGIALSDPQAYEVTFNFTYTEASKIGCARATFLTVIEALVRHGFIDPMKRGGVFDGKKVSSIYRLSQRWKAYGTPGFRSKDYRRWAVTAGRETIPPVQEGEREYL
jgi:hypothetical protein